MRWAALLHFMCHFLPVPVSVLNPCFVQPKKTTVKMMSHLICALWPWLLPSWRCLRELYCHSCKALLLIFSTLFSLHTAEGGECKMLFCMFCITNILIWTNSVPKSVSCSLTFLAHSIQSSLTYWQRNSWRWRLASQLYSGYSIFWLIGLGL